MKTEDAVIADAPMQGVRRRTLRLGRDSGKVAVGQEDLERAFFENSGGRFPPVLNIQQAAELLQVSVGTLYEWSSKGYLKGCCRHRGKRLFFWRDGLIREMFEGKEWKHE